VPAEEALVVENRGVLCSGCADAVEAALAARRGGTTYIRGHDTSARRRRE
jgi:copper chaperone CopZ